VLYQDVDQQQGPDQLVLVEVAARQELGPHLLLELEVPFLAYPSLGPLALVVEVLERTPFPRLILMINLFDVPQ
jgi:hypothetical protein